MTGNKRSGRKPKPNARRTGVHLSEDVLDYLSQSGNVSSAIENLVRQTMTTTISEIDVIPELDPWNANINASTQTAILLDPETRTLRVYQADGDNAVSESVWHGRSLTARVKNTTEQAARDYLTGNPLIERVISGHSVDWDGRNMVGSLTDDAAAAWDELIAGFEDLPDGWSYWPIDDYLAQAQIPDDLTDDQIADLVAQIEAEATSEMVVIGGDVADYIRSRQA